MNIEIEKKFLLKRQDQAFYLFKQRIPEQTILIKQAYFNTLSNAVRVRISNCVGVETAEICIKTSNPSGVGCLEFEYPIPVADAEMIYESLPDSIEKVRRRYVLSSGAVWEVDEFLGEYSGVTIAEIELPSLDHPFEMIPGEFVEVTNNIRFTNKYMAINRDKSLVLEGYGIEDH